MIIYSATKARANLYRVMEQAAESHEPVYITGKKTNAVLITEEDWSAMQETLYLLSIPGMGQSIQEGLEVPLKDCDKDIEW